ncbi:MAG TPA: hypothetical protein VFS00_30680 [Polyangiaceae bacterium]|nr:hypothetical protein [Polyangiaceae bacterium]
MSHLPSLAAFALTLCACSSPEAPARTTATLGPVPNSAPGTAAANPAGDAVSSPPPTNAGEAKPSGTSTPRPACVVMAKSECHPSLAAACASIACPSEMCVAEGEQPATARCNR